MSSAEPIAARPGAARARGLVASALAAVSSWLVEPADTVPPAPAAAPARARPVVAVFGLARGCGVTVVSRALAAELAARDPDGAAAVHREARTAGIPLATQAATRLARALADVPGADTRAVGRLCLVAAAERAALADTARCLAPLVLDAGSTSLGGVPAAVADRTVLVGTAAVEPALASVAANCLARLGHDPIVVLNRAAAEEGVAAEGVAAEEGMAAEADTAGWRARTTHVLPESRMGAQLALGGREPRGELGRAVAELADLCEAPR